MKFTASAVCSYMHSSCVARTNVDDTEVSTCVLSSICLPKQLHIVLFIVCVLQLMHVLVLDLNEPSNVSSFEL